MNRPYAYCLALPVVMVAAGAFAASPSPLQLTQSTVQSSTVEIIAPSAPPPLRSEEMPPPPSPDTVVWEAGYWSWSGNTWVWVAGHYVARPSAQAIWEPGHWLQQADGWLWVDGRWRVAQR